MKDYFEDVFYFPAYVVYNIIGIILVILNYNNTDFMTDVFINVDKAEEDVNDKISEFISDRALNVISVVFWLCVIYLIFL